MVCLIKPQFEAGREKVGKKGVVRDKKVHKEVIEKVIDFAVRYSDFMCGIWNILRSKDRKEILSIWYILKMAQTGQRRESVDIDAVVEAAHAELDSSYEKFLCHHQCGKG